MTTTSIGTAVAALVTTFTAAASAQSGLPPAAPSTAYVAPMGDHHHHLPSAAAVQLLNLAQPAASPVSPPTAEQALALLDEAGIQRAVLLSTAYWFASDRMPRVEGDEYANVRRENDWTARQAARFPDRFIAFCSLNPLRDYALEEISRCTTLGSVKGLKLHIANSSVDMLNPEHVEKLRRVFSAANQRGFSIVAHLWAGGSYGHEHALAFLERVLPMAPDVVVQIAHFAGGGPGYTDAALAVYADAIAAGDPATKNLYFDIATVANFQPPQVLSTFATRIRQVGLQRVLFGTDVGNPRQSWTTFSTTVPLTREEIAAIATNVAPYLR